MPSAIVLAAGSNLFSGLAAWWGFVPTRIDEPGKKSDGTQFCHASSILTAEKENTHT
jgi:hypothetical protein